MADQYLRELIACLERAGSFGFCGSGKVLTTTSMGPLLLSAGIKQTGFPSLNHHIVILRPQQSSSISVLPERWPKEDDGDLYFASQRTIIWTYGKTLWNVGWFFYCWALHIYISDNLVATMLSASIV